MDTTIEIALALFAVQCAGAALPLLRRWSHRGLHLFVSVSAGIFLGTIFLHLMPEVAAHPEAGGGEHGSLAPWIAALFGLLVLFVVERVWLAGRTGGKGDDPHLVLWSATYLGLTLHAFSTGLGLAPWLSDSEVIGPLILPVLIHKTTEAFSLATVMRLAGLRNSQAIGLLVLFSLVAPIGLVLGREIALADAELNQVLSGFAVGTFLYVALLDLLPEVFHGNERRMPKLLFLVLGIALTAVNVPRVEWLGGLSVAILEESLAVFVEMAPFLLLGFTIAGVLNRWIRPAWLSRHLARDDAKSVAIATLVGAPLPLCSCSVLPVAASMRRSGASKGATSAFLIATPETGVDSVTVTYALLGPVMAVLRPVSAIVSAFATGSAVSAFVRSGLDREPRSSVAAPSPPAATPVAECCASDEHHAPPPAAPAPAEPKGFVRHVLRYAFVDMLDDLTGPMLLGVVLAGAIGALVPAEVFQAPLAQGFPSMLVMLLVGVPIYVCAAASTPIAAAMMLKGLSPGAALVFLLSGPATNLGSLFVITRYLGKRVVVVHVLVLGLVTLALGLLTDFGYRVLSIEPEATLGVGAHLVPHALSIACAVVLASLMLVSLVRTRLSGLLVERFGRPRPQIGGPSEAQG